MSIINLTMTSTTGSRARISGDAPLVEVAFAVEIMASNYLGRGVSRFECQRTKESDGSCSLQFNPIGANEVGPVIMSKVASIGYAVKEKIFPFDLKESFHMEEPGFVPEGQHRHRSAWSRKGPGNTVSIVESHDFDPNTSLSLISYGLGDMFTGLFNLNVYYIKWQGSFKRTQLYIRHGMTDERLHKFLVADLDYPIKKKVVELT